MRVADLLSLLFEGSVKRGNDRNAFPLNPDTLIIDMNIEPYKEGNPIQGYGLSNPLPLTFTLPLLDEELDVPTILFFLSVCEKWHKPAPHSLRASDQDIKTDFIINNIVAYFPSTMELNDSFCLQCISTGLNLSSLPDDSHFTPSFLSKITRRYKTLKDAITSFLPSPTTLLTLSVLPNTPPPHPTPYLIPFPSTIFVKSISCGGEHSAVGALDGSFWTWGRGGFGRLGHGNNTKDVWRPKRVKFQEGKVKVDVVACGYAYTCVGGELDGVKGKMWSFGANENGRLGTGDDKDKFVPTLVRFEGEGGGGGR